MATRRQRPPRRRGIDPGLRRAAALLTCTMPAVLAACGSPPHADADGPVGPRLGTVVLEPVSDALNAPIAVVSAGDGSHRLFVVERRGLVRAFEDGQLSDTPYLDLSPELAPPAGENGLLGLAFHPDFAANGRLFVHYTPSAPDTQGVLNVVAELRAEPPGAAFVDVATLTEVITAVPASAFHLGGDLGFGPDGHLYVALGDGGTPDAAQDLGRLHGSLLRLQVDGTLDQPYLVPVDNPFAGDAQARGEIWAYGLRNPWRFSFDGATGDLWIADVGQNAVEEVNLKRAADGGGQNYGWPIMEGDRCYPEEPCDSTGLTLPVLTYTHESGLGRAVIGGHVYRGAGIAPLAGAYVFGDYVSGNVFAASAIEEGYQQELLIESDLRIVAFGRDEASDLYLVDIAGGGLYRLAPDAEALP